MQHHLKTRSKTACLIVFCCVLLISSLSGLQHASLAHAASLQTARTTMPERSSSCQPPQCHPFPYHDLYVFSTNMVWGYNTGTFDLIDNGAIGVTNEGSATSGQYGSIQGVIARGNTVYEWRITPNGQGIETFLFAVVYGGCTTSTGYCLILLDDNPNTFLVSAGITGLYQEHSSGTVWQLTGLCYHCWQEIDTNASHDLVASDHVYDTHLDGSVWRYNGTPYSWTEVDNNPTNADVSLAIDTNNVVYELRQMLSNGQLISSSVLEGYGPFNFQAIDTTHLTYSIVADQRLYQSGNAGILMYEGGNSWGVASNNGSVQDIEPADESDAVYWELSDNSFWQYTPANGTSEILGSEPSLKMARPEWAIALL